MACFLSILIASILPTRHKETGLKYPKTSDQNDRHHAFLLKERTENNHHVITFGDHHDFMMTMTHDASSDITFGRTSAYYDDINLLLL